MARSLTVSAISVAYSEHEDRLAIVVTSQADERLALMLTRRLAGRLINGLASLLERTSALAQDVPVETRDAVVLFEHQGALNQSKTNNDQQAEPSDKNNNERVPMLMLTDISVTTHPKHFIVTLQHTNEIIAKFKCGRNDLHRLIAMLRSKCEEADWNLSIDVNWLLPNADGSMTVN